MPVSSIDEIGTGGSHKQERPLDVAGELLDQVEQGRLRPVEVLDQGHEREVCDQGVQEGDPCIVKLVPGSQRMKIAGDVQSERETEDLSVTQPPPDVGWRVALQDPQVLAKHLAERPVGDAPAVREAASRAAKRLWAFISQPLPEFANEPSLPDACVAYDGDEPWAALLDRPTVGDEQSFEFLLSPDERSAESLDPARAR